MNRWFFSVMARAASASVALRWLTAQPAEEQLGRGLGCVADGLDVAEGFHCVLREPQVLHPMRQLAVFDRERPVACHPRQHGFLLADDVRVMEPRDEQPSLGACDKL